MQRADLAKALSAYPVFKDLEPELKEQAISALDRAVRARVSIGMDEGRALADALGEICPSLFEPRLQEGTRKLAISLAIWVAVFTFWQLFFTWRFSDIIQKVWIAIRLDAVTSAFFWMSERMRAVWPIIMFALAAIWVYALVPRWHRTPSVLRQMILRVALLLFLLLSTSAVIASIMSLVNLIRGNLGPD